MTSGKWLINISFNLLSVLFWAAASYSQQYIGSCYFYRAQFVSCSGNYAFVASPFLFCSIDVSNPANPIICDTLSHTNYWPHIFIDKGFAYLSGAHIAEALSIINILNPDSLCLTSTFDPPHSGSVHCSYVRHDIAYLAICSGIVILNVVDKYNPVEMTYKRLGPDNRAIWINGNTAFMPNFTLPRFYVLDISDAQHPETLSTSRITPINSYYLSSHENYVYSPSYTRIRVIDVSNPREPFTVDSLGGFGHAVTTVVLNHRLFVADEDSGLFLYNIQNAAHPILESRYMTSCRSVFATGNYIYLAGSDSLTILQYDSTPINNERILESDNACILKAYPNPFNLATVISTGRDESVDIAIYDIHGGQAAYLHSKNGQAIWNAAGLSSGVYFAKVAGDMDGAGIKLIYLK
jgi:hypothetical protein